MTVRLTKSKRIALRAKLWELQGHRCCYCRRYVYLDVYLDFDHGTQTATLEHLRRLIDGGTDHPSNLALACHQCNSSRGDMNWAEFATLMQPAPVAANSNFGTIPHHGPINEASGR